MRGSKPIEAAKNTIKTLKELKVPFILLTNGGGKLESLRTEFLSKQLENHISPLQLIQSHTPFKCLTSRFERVLCVGGDALNVREVAYNYGFKDPILPMDIINADRSIWPFYQYPEEMISKYARPNHDCHVVGDNAKAIDCVLVFNDPRDMGSDVQIILDLLNSEAGLLGTRRSFKEYSSKPAVPIFFSNNDFLWANDYSLPRFGQGALKFQIDLLYSQCNNGANLESVVLGKPERVTYDFAHHILIDWRSKLHAKSSKVFEEDQLIPELAVSPTNSPFKKVFMVGDNPESDIVGANNYGWDSILLRTGVFKDQDFVDDVSGRFARPTCGVFDNVQLGVEHVLQRHGIAV